MKTKRERALPALVLMISTAMVVAACGGGSKEPATPNIDDQPWEVTVESPLDTITVTTYGESEDDLAADPWNPAPPEGTEIEAPLMTTPLMTTPLVTETQTPMEQSVPDPQVFTPGWRVQIFAASSMVNADELAEMARRRFTEPVYVEFEPPMYKVRVGDFMTRSAADNMKTRAKAEEFEDAFVVEALVVRPG